MNQADHINACPVGAAYQAFGAYTALRLGLVTVAGLAILAGSVWYMAAVALRATAYPRWMAAFSPFTFILLLGLTAGFVRPLALVIAPTALNLSHLAYFALFTVTLWNTAGRDDFGTAAPP